MVQPTSLPIFMRVQNEGNDSAFERLFVDADRAASRSRESFERNFSEVQNVVRSALSVGRNELGSLDLNVGNLREQAADANAVATAFEEVAVAARRASGGQGELTAENRAYVAAAEASAREAREQASTLNVQAQAYDRLQQELNETASATDRVVQNQQRGTNAFGAVTNSLRSQRFAMIQVGQQLQDVTVGFASGQRAATIFAQQLPQLGFAFSGFEGSANKTLNTLGRVGTFLAGPWGVAVFAATTALGFLAAEFFKTDDAAKDAENSSIDFANGLDVVRLTAQQTTNALFQLIGETESLIRTQEDLARRNRALSQQAAIDIQAKLDANKAALDAADQEALSKPLFGIFGDKNARQAVLEQERKQLIAALRLAETNTETAGVAISQNNVDARLDPGVALRQRFDAEETKLTNRRLGTISGRINPIDGISEQEFERDLFEVRQRRQRAEQELAESSKKKRTRTPKKDNSAEKSRRETERLSRVSDQSAEQIRRINEQFDDQPRLVDQSARAVRQLDSVLAELSKPENSGVPRLGELIEEYEEARELAANAVSNQIERDFQDDERRLEVQRLIAEGREYEAQILERINAAEQQFGLQARLDDLEDQASVQSGILEDAESTADEHEAARSALAGISSEMADIRADQADITSNTEDQVEQEILINEQLQIRNEEQQRYLQTIGGIRTELEGFFNGEGADFSGLFQRLRSQTLVENIFGDSLRDLENSVTGRRGPVGQAVDDLAKETGNVEERMAEFADVVEKVTGRVSSVLGETNVAANDNGINVGADGEIVVNGVVGGTGSGISLSEFTRSASETITLPLIEALNDVLGTEFFTRFEGVFQSGLEGLFRAGPVGGILGTLQGLTAQGGLLESAGLSEAFGKALEGAQTGQQTNAILSSLGIKTSQTGSTIGGALGGLTGIPGGDIIGSLLGGFVSGALRGSRRGSATIGGTGSDLIVGSTRGNSSSRQEQASGLLGQTIENIDRIAEQLGASVNASRGAVSLGIRDDNIRLDRTGRGITKTRNGAVDFGDDAEGAIRAATLDLIQDGVLEGLRRGTEQLLRQARTIEQGLRDALDFENVFRDLAQARNPLQFALDELDREFTDLSELFTRAGASAQEFADLEELYGIRRREILEDVGEEFIGTLRDFLSELTTGDNGLSLRDRRNAALQEFNPLAEAIQRGERVDYDEFTAAAQTVLQIERDLFGSQSPYFDRLRDITDLTRDALGREQDIVDGASQGGLFGINGGAEPLTFEPATNAINAMNDNVAGILRQINDNIVNGGGIPPAPPRTGRGGGGGRNPGFSNELNLL